MEFLATIRNALSQSFYIPAPILTEKNVPDQTSRIHLITGGYTGCGKELARILYHANAEVWIAGRSREKADAAITDIKSSPTGTSKGSLHFLQLDLANLTTIRPAVDLFLMETKGRLHVLTNNAGVMIPPSGSKSAQGHELQIATNCLGPFLLTRLLTPALRSTAASLPSSSFPSENGGGGTAGPVRVTWASSLAMDLVSPGRGGLDLSLATGGPKTLGRQLDYGQSKVGNFYLAVEFARQEEDCVASGEGDRARKVVHCAWNPGNLRTELQRHVSALEGWVISIILHPARFGAYTELYAALSPSVSPPPPHSNADAPPPPASYIAPWGRVGTCRSDIREQASSKGKREREEGLPSRFWRWCEGCTGDYA